MSLSGALADLLAAVEAGGGRAVFSFDMVKLWGEGTAKTLCDQGLLKTTAAAQSLECQGCEESCFSDVVMQPSKSGKSRAFIICEMPHKQAEMGRVPVRLERLQQWQASIGLLAAFVAGKLRLEGDGEVTKDSQPVRLGMMKGPHGRRWVAVLSKPLVLELNQQAVPLSELLFAEADLVALDMPCIQKLLEADTQPAKKAYTPSIDRQAARNMQTQAMYQDWQDVYEKLKQKHPDKSKKWCSLKIARMSVGRGKQSETIRKRIK